MKVPYISTDCVTCRGAKGDPFTVLHQNMLQRDMCTKGCYNMSPNEGLSGKDVASSKCT